MVLGCDVVLVVLTRKENMVALEVWDASKEED